MITIDVNGELSAFRARELKESLNYFVKSVENELVSFVKNGNENRKEGIVKKISLQDALNLNKYALDFEQLVKHGDVNGHTFRGYYTEQDPQRKLPIYSEADTQERYAIREEDSQFYTVNEYYANEYDFER